MHRYVYSLHYVYVQIYNRWNGTRVHRVLQKYVHVYIYTYVYMAIYTTPEIKYIGVCRFDTLSCHIKIIGASQSSCIK